MLPVRSWMARPEQSPIQCRPKGASVQLAFTEPTMCLHLAASQPALKPPQDLNRLGTAVGASSPKKHAQG